MRKSNWDLLVQNPEAGDNLIEYIITDTLTTSKTFVHSTTDEHGGHDYAISTSSEKVGSLKYRLRRTVTYVEQETVDLSVPFNADTFTGSVSTTPASSSSNANAGPSLETVRRNTQPESVFGAWLAGFAKGYLVGQVNIYDQLTFEAITPLHDFNVQNQIDTGVYGSTTMQIASLGAIAAREATIALATGGLGNVATGTRAATWVGKAAYAGHMAGVGYETVSALNQAKIGAEKLADGNLWGLADIALGAVPLAGLKNTLRLPGARVTTPGPVAAGLDDAANIAKIGPRTVNPAEFTRTHGLSGRASSRHVRELTESMQKNGFQGDSIKVFEHGGEKFVLDGHHRIIAARRAGLDKVPFESIPESRLGEFNFKNADEVITTAREAGGIRLRP